MKCSGKKEGYIIDVVRLFWIQITHCTLRYDIDYNFIRKEAFSAQTEAIINLISVENQ